VPLEVIVCVFGNRNTLGVLYISYSVVDDQRHKQPPRLALFFVHNGPQRDGASSYPQRAKSSKGTHLSLLRQCHNMKGSDSTDQGKTKHTPT